jgi:hypothetical protein
MILILFCTTLPVNGPKGPVKGLVMFHPVLILI